MATQAELDAYKGLTKREIVNYAVDSLGMSASDFADTSTVELIAMLQEAGEYQHCLDYNNKQPVEAA